MIKLMFRFIQFIAISLTLASCVTQNRAKDNVTSTASTQKSSRVYKQVETKLQQPLGTDSNADLKVMIESNHKDYNLDMAQCNYAERYLKNQTCASKKLQNNQSVTVKCVAANDLTYSITERGTCAKLVCVDTDRADCLREGNSAISLAF